MACGHVPIIMKLNTPKFLSMKRAAHLNYLLCSTHKTATTYGSIAKYIPDGGVSNSCTTCVLVYRVCCLPVYVVYKAHLSAESRVCWSNWSYQVDPVYPVEPVDQKTSRLVGTSRSGRPVHGCCK